MCRSHISQENKAPSRYDILPDQLLKAEKANLNIDNQSDPIHLVTRKLKKTNILSNRA